MKQLVRRALLVVAHSIVGGTAWEPTLSRAMQRAAWAAASKEEARR